MKITLHRWANPRSNHRLTHKSEQRKYKVKNRITYININVLTEKISFDLFVFKNKLLPLCQN